MLGEADYSMTEQAHLAGSNQGRYANDDALFVRFFMRPKLDQEKSTEAGRPIYVDFPHIQIMQPGNKESIIERPANDMDKQRFARHWRAFQDRVNDDDLVEGTRLEEWPGISRSQVEELKFFNVHTLEQLVAMSDSNAQGFMGINALKQRAQAYLDAASDNAAAEQLAEAKRQNEELQERLAAMAERIEALEAEEEDED